MTFQTFFLERKNRENILNATKNHPKIPQPNTASNQTNTSQIHLPHPPEPFAKYFTANSPVRKRLARQAPRLGVLSNPLSARYAIGDAQEGGGSLAEARIDRGKVGRAAEARAASRLRRKPPEPINGPGTMRRKKRARLSASRRRTILSGGGSRASLCRARGATFPGPAARETPTMPS